MIENHWQSAFLEYVERKIAEKGKLDVGKAVEKAIHERFYFEWWDDKCGFLASDIAPAD